MITVLLADDHAFVLNSLRALLDAADDIQVVAMAPDGVEAVVQASLYCPDVAVIDISMPLMDGIEATKQICAICPYTRIMTISMFDHPEYVQRSLQAGALGYVLKDEVFSDLLDAVRAIHKGNKYFSQKIAGIAERYTHQGGNDSLPG
jgi:DNA-binding NarL/FixJ family response regulator